jgi:hypothetical protein
METKVLVMKPGEPSELRTFELPERPRYNEIADLVELLIGVTRCEHVSVLADFAGGLTFRESDLFVDEMGHPKGLPRKRERDRYLSPRLTHKRKRSPGRFAVDRRAGRPVRAHRLDVREGKAKCEHALNGWKPGAM